MKSAKFSIAIMRRIITKLLAISEILKNIKFRLHWILFGIYHISAVIWKQKLCMETRLCNIFKTVNTIMLAKTILENPYIIKFRKVYGKELSICKFTAK